MVVRRDVERVDVRRKKIEVVPFDSVGSYDAGRLRQDNLIPRWSDDETVDGRVVRPGLLMTVRVSGNLCAATTPLQ